MLQRLINEARQALEAQTVHIAGAPADVNRYYEECRKEQPGESKEYCARVAWQRFCTHKQPSHSSCTKYGKTKASLPIRDSLGEAFTAAEVARVLPGKVVRDAVKFLRDMSGWYVEDNDGIDGVTVSHGAGSYMLTVSFSDTDQPEAEARISISQEETPLRRKYVSYRPGNLKEFKRVVGLGLQMLRREMG